jgi:hypothetical protein
MRLMMVSLVSLLLASATLVQAAGLPKAAMQNPKLLKEMLGAASVKLKPDAVVAGVITDGSWNVEQNGLGVVTRRTIHGAFSVKQASGKCRVFDLLFQQRAAGPGRFNGTEAAGIGRSTQVECGK